MKSKLFILFSLWALTFLQPVTIEAKKPAYCEDALRKCVDTCSVIFDDWFTENACRAGCAIGYINCGSNN